MRLTLLITILFLTACGSYNVRNLAKSDIDMVVDEFIDETRRLNMELMSKLYRRNPDQLARNPGMTIEKRIEQFLNKPKHLRFEELNKKEELAALELVFDPAFKGDRVFMLAVGLGGMLRKSYGYKDEVFMFDELNAQTLTNSAYNIEVLMWCLKTVKTPEGKPFLISSHSNGIADNLSFERLFGRMIGLQRMMATIIGRKTDRAVTTVVHGVVSTVFIPI